MTCYRRSHIIQQRAGAGTGYQIKIIVHSGNGTTQNGTNELWCNNHCKNDFSDIRFTASDGYTPLPFWCESLTQADQAVFWVKILDDLSSANSTIWVYYTLNYDATYTPYPSANNGKETFLFFDDFTVARSFEMEHLEGRRYGGRYRG